MKVYERRSAGFTGQVRPLPAERASSTYDTLGTVDCTGSPLTATYNEVAGCAKLYVSGQYTGDLTLASADDIIIKPSAPPANSGAAGREPHPQRRLRAGPDRRQLRPRLPQGRRRTTATTNLDRR